MLNPDYSVALNFLALTTQEFWFTVYRKRCDDVSTKVKPDWYRGSLPIESGSSESLKGERHIEFYYASQKLSDSAKMRYLQDVINLSGANWRGFNAKSLPVSIYYCQLIARRIKEFDAYGYEDVQIETSTPWFL